ncbi:GntR family transcriptional regulator [Pseudonocardiaceae bacterium YIM PH 21723]|nr:GntR family transcriptional regulator [Pseudonocardiaceae bacterium YIM PH 21723]
MATLELPPGSPLPSERDLATQYKVSRLTVREAISQLAAEGLLTRARGKGTFTARPALDNQARLSSFTQDTIKLGLQPSSVVLRTGIGIPDEQVCANLGLRQWEPAYSVERLRLVGGQPVSVQRGWYHAGHVPGLIDRDLTGSLYALLANDYGLILDSGRQTVSAQQADDETADLLRLPAQSPLLVFHRIATANHRPVEDMTSFYRGDSYQITMKLDRYTEQPGPKFVPGGTDEH